MVRLDYGVSGKPPKNTLKKFVCNSYFMSFLTLKYLIFYFNDNVFMKF